MPIITFINKLDREGRDPFDLIDEIEQTLALDATPASWPIGMGRDFLGTYDLFGESLLLFERGLNDRDAIEEIGEPLRVRGIDDPLLAAAAAGQTRSRRCASRSRWRAACAPNSTSPRSAKAT